MTRGPGDREIKEAIAQSGDRWSVTKWPPTGQVAEKSRDKSPRTVIGGHTECPPIDQFPDEHLGAKREKQEKTDQSSGYMIIGVSCYTQLNWDCGSQRERYAWISCDPISEKEELLAGRVVHESGLRELVNRSVIGDSLNPLRA